MRYIEGYHGIFRDNNVRPTTWELAQYRKDFYDEHPDAPRLETNQFFSFWAVLIGVLVLVSGCIADNGCLAMVGISGAVLFIALKYIVLFNKGNYPKEEKSSMILPVAALGASLLIFVYNVLRLINIIPASKLGDDLVAATSVAWVGCVTVLMQLFYAVKMLVRCRAKTEGILIGYSDYESTTSSSHSHATHRVVASNYVYSFDADGEEYIVLARSGSINDIFKRDLGSSHVIKYDPNNPEFCMVKHFELKAIIFALIAGLICGWFSVNVFSSIVKYDLNDPYGKNLATMPAIIVIDDDGVVRSMDDQPVDETTVEETSVTPEPTPIPLYSDEWINSVYDTDDYVCYVYPVVSVEGDNAYMGTVPGLYSRFVPLDNLEVGDEILFINFRGTYAYFKLNEGEAYTGSHTPEEMGWVAEDGRFIFGEDYVDFYYGDGYEICTYTVQGQEGNDYLIGCDEYSYVFNESYIEDFSHWNMETGHVYYAARNDQTVFIVDSDLFVLP